MNFRFTYTNLEEQYKTIIDAGYTVMTCYEYYLRKKEISNNHKVLVNRIDIDFSLKKAIPMLDIYHKLGIKGSFFIRLHANEYNPFSFENYSIIKRMIDEGHEIGYHSEVIDQAAIWNEDPEVCLKRDIAILNKYFNIEIKGVASHGGMTGLNNLDFWANKSAKQFGLCYEAYDKEPEFDLFNKSFYISDSEWTRWKCYKNGKLIVGDNNPPVNHLGEVNPLIYFLIHSDTYFHNHFYEL